MLKHRTKKRLRKLGRRICGLPVILFAQREYRDQGYLLRVRLRIDGDGPLLEHYTDNLPDAVKFWLKNM